MPIPLRKPVARAHRRPPVPYEIGRIRDGLESAVVAAFAVSPTALYRRSRGKAPAALARQAAIYVAHVGFGLTLTEAGGLFGRDRTTAAHACRLIEERRDDAVLDLLLTVVERQCGCTRDCEARS